MLCAKSKQAKSNSVSLNFFFVILNYIKVFGHISFQTINLGALSQKKKKNKSESDLIITSPSTFFAPFHFTF